MKETSELRSVGRFGTILDNMDTWHQLEAKRAGPVNIIS